MSRARELIENAVFIGGMPRSGTTFLARSLNSHPQFVVSADDHVLESWGLYYYRSRVGMVDGLRRGTLRGETAIQNLEGHLFNTGALLRAVPSDKVSSFPLSAPPVRPDGDPERHEVPLVSFPSSWRLVLKSPEITYALEDLAGLLPAARFVMVYRPLAEVAESMYRMGERVKKVKIFHRRWQDEKDETGRLVPPPGVPPEWGAIWSEVTDFQRCVINGASYLKALAQTCDLLPVTQVFFVNHRDLRKDPVTFFSSLARFLGVDDSGFEETAKQVARKFPALAPSLTTELELLLGRLSIDRLTEKLETVAIRKHP